MRWTPDVVAFRDATREGGARPHALKKLARFVDELRALGFVELGIVAAHFASTDEDDLPQFSMVELRDLERAVDDGLDGAPERLAWAREMTGLRDLWSNENLTWVWTHPGTHDTAHLESTAHGDWVTFRSLYEDGSLVRTSRRPDGMGHDAPGATGFFVDSPVPGLYALMCRLAGDHFMVGKGPKPKLRQWDHVTDAATATEAWAVHRGHVDALAVASPAVPSDMPLTLAQNRRTMHVTLEGLERAGRWSAWVGGVLSTVGTVSAAFLVAGATGSFVQGGVAAVLLPWASSSWWSVACGGAPATVVLAPTALVCGAIWWADLPLAVAGVAIVVAFVGTVASRLVSFWLSGAGRSWVEPWIAVPPPLAAAELLERYPE